MDNIAVEMTKTQLFVSRIKTWFTINISRKLPRLVWYGDELDVRVTFSQDPIDQSMSADELFDGLTSGGLYEAQSSLNGMGVSFDVGMGENGRDWEWDYSLEGPISVKFCGKTKIIEKRKARHVLHLVH
jgi:hypothetical protein